MEVVLQLNPISEGSGIHGLSKRMFRLDGVIRRYLEVDGQKWMEGVSRNA